MTLCVLVLYGSTSWLVYSLVRRSALAHLQQNIEERLSGFINDIDWKAGRLDLDFHINSPAEYAEGTRMAFYELRDHQHQVVVRSYSLGLKESLPEFAAKPLQAKLDDGVKVYALARSFRPPLDQDSQRPDTQAPPTDSPGNVFELTVAESTAGMDRQLRDIAEALLLGGLFLVASCSVVASLMARWLNQPVLRVAENVASIDTTTLHKRLSLNHTPREMRPIITQFNALLDRVTHAMQRERRFSTAIAHELRTPLAELQSLADVALIDCDHDPSLREDPRDVFLETTAITARMGHLLDLLAVIHRTDDGQTRLQTRKIDLREVMLKLGDLFRADILASGRDLEITLSASAILVRTDPSVLEAIATNLLRNALQHATPGCLIELAVTSSPPTLSVSNATDTLVVEDLAKLTEPLWQKDTSRTEQERFGIGLTLSRAYTELIGARLSFALDGEVFIASVILPVPHSF